MREWWNGLSILSQIFAAIAIPATLIMIIQSLMMFLGLGFESDVEADISENIDYNVHDSSDGLSLITVRGMVAFFAIGGWAGLVARITSYNVCYTKLLRMRHFSTASTSSRCRIACAYRKR